MLLVDNIAVVGASMKDIITTKHRLSGNEHRRERTQGEHKEDRNGYIEL